MATSKLWLVATLTAVNVAAYAAAHWLQSSMIVVTSLLSDYSDAGQSIHSDNGLASGWQANEWCELGSWPEQFAPQTTLDSAAFLLP